MAPELLDAVAGLGADWMDGDAERDRLGFRELSLEIRREIGLVEDDDRIRAALPGRREVALEPAHVEVPLVESHHEEGDFDVRDKHLFRDRGPRCLPRELAASRQNEVDQAVAKPDPIADDGQLARIGLVAQTPCDLNERFAALGNDLPGAAMLHGDATGLELGGFSFELASELVVPTESLELGELQVDSFPARTGNASRRTGVALAEKGPANEDAVKLSCHGASFRRGPARYCASRRVGTPDLN